MLIAQETMADPYALKYTGRHSLVVGHQGGGTFFAETDSYSGIPLGGETSMRGLRK